MSALHTMSTILGIDAMRRVAGWLELPLTGVIVNDRSPTSTTPTTPDPPTTSTTPTTPTESTTTTTPTTPTRPTTPTTPTTPTESTTTTTPTTPTTPTESTTPTTPTEARPEAPLARPEAAPEPSSCDDAPPAELSEESSDRLRDVLAGLPGTSETHRYVGAVAASRGVADAVRPLIPEGGRGAYDEGVNAHSKSLRVPRPAELDDAGQRRLVRALDRAARSDAEVVDQAGPVEAPSILRLVRRTAGPQRGGIFDMTISYRGVSAILAGLTSSTLLAYGQVCAAALGEGLVLPDLGKRTGATWRDALAIAMASVIVEPVAGDEDVSTVIEEEIVRCLRDSPRVAAARDMTEPGVICLDGAWVVVRSADVVRTVRAALADDHVSRADVVEAARRLGLEAQPYRPRVADGTQPSLWRLPASLLGGSSEVSDAP